jgi:branched-chain amino acid transport system ATP-binding protein
LREALAKELFGVVKEINATGVAVLLVEQNSQHALSIANHGYALKFGRVVLSGSGWELLENEAVRKSYLEL